jgi:uncharacterized phiE125 gp8 family phage protein
MAAGDLTTLANAKSWLTIPDTNNDVLLVRLISAASAFLINWLNRDIMQATYTAEKYNGNGKTAMHLRNWPIQSVSSLLVNGVVVQASPDGLSNGYVFDEKFIYLLGANVNSFPPGTFGKGIMNISVTYVAGYATVPLDIEQACIELVSLKFKERGRIGIQSQQVPGQASMTYSPRDLGKDTKEMLQNYRAVVPI